VVCRSTRLEAVGILPDTYSMNSRITLFENEFAHMWYYPDDGIIYHQILQPIAGEPFRNLLLTGLRSLKEHSAHKWLSDDRLNSILSAEDSAWSQEYWLPRAYKAGWKQWALLPPDKARGQINIKRLAHYISERYKVNVQFFSDPDTALQWLLDQGDDCCK
jgi:hypothetical protein